MATPTLVQSLHGGMGTNDLGTLTGANTSLKFFFPNASLNGNLLVVAFQCNNALTVSSVIDSASNSWTAGPSFDNTTTGDRAALYYLAGATNTGGITFVTVQFSAGSGFPPYSQGHFSEWYNVATSSPLDVSIGTASDTSSPYNAGSITTTVDADLVVSYGFGFGGGSGGTLSALTAGTAGSGFTLMGADINAGNTNTGTIAQYQVQATHGAINADFTTSGRTNATYGMLVAAFKNASAGTAPSAGIRVVAVQHQYLGTSPAGTLQFPCPVGCNLLVGLFNDDDAFITGLTDSASNTWSFPAGGKADNSANNTTAQVIYAAAATCSPTLKTMSYTYSKSPAVNSNPFIVLYAISGADTSPFDNAQTSTGNLATTGSITSTSITPAAANGLVLCCISVSWNTVQTVSVSGQTAFFDSVLDAAQDNNDSAGGSNTSTMDEDNGNAHVYNSNTSAESFVWTVNGVGSSRQGPGQWASAAAAFKASSGSETITIDKWFSPGRDPIRRRRGVVSSGTVGIKS